ncbi:MAG: hypothetical protein ACLFM1_08245 [Bacteroidales bacterium]
MKRIILHSILLLCFISLPALMSCESQEHISVTVIDSHSKEPLDSVLVEVRAGNDENYSQNYDDGFTDSTGHYETHMMIGCSFGCYDIQTTYIKEKYKKLIQVNNLRDTIEMHPSDN